MTENYNEPDIEGLLAEMLKDAEIREARFGFTKATVLITIVFSILFAFAWFLYMLFSDHCYGGNAKIINTLEQYKWLEMLKALVKMGDEYECPIVLKIHEVFQVHF